MNWLDVVLLAVLVASAVAGLFKGLVGLGLLLGGIAVVVLLIVALPVGIVVLVAFGALGLVKLVAVAVA